MRAQLEFSPWLSNEVIVCFLRVIGTVHVGAPLISKDAHIPLGGQDAQTLFSSLDKILLLLFFFFLVGSGIYTHESLWSVLTNVCVKCLSGLVL